MTYFIEVTQFYIDNSTREDPLGCPVANAVVRETGIGGVCADLERLDVPGCRTAFLPTRVCDWIERYDAGKPVKPIRFSVELEPTETEGS